MNITQLTSQAAKDAHAELLSSLGSENNPQQWMIFMEAVDKHIPEMSSKGRLSALTIERSLIGQLGFKSWKEYLESPLEKGGLNWSSGGWNSFRRAWTLVKDYPFLRQEQIKAGWLNAFANEIKKDNLEFPKNSRELEEVQSQKAEKKAENKSLQLTETSAKLKDSAEENEQLQLDLEALRKENAELNAKIEGFETAYSQVIDRNLKTITKQENQISRMSNQISVLKHKEHSLWEAVKAIFIR